MGLIFDILDTITLLHQQNPTGNSTPSVILRFCVIATREADDDEQRSEDEADFVDHDLFSCRRAWDPLCEDYQRRLNKIAQNEGFVNPQDQ